MRAVLKGRQMFNCFKCVGSTLYFCFFFFFPQAVKCSDQCSVADLYTDKFFVHFK